MTATGKSKKINQKKKESTKETIKLIESTFDVREAQDVLIGLLNHKINFHTLKNFSWSERFGHLNKQSVARLEELKKDRDKIASLLDFARENKLNIQVYSKIEIHLTQ